MLQIEISRQSEKTWRHISKKRWESFQQEVIERVFRETKQHPEIYLGKTEVALTETGYCDNAVIQWFDVEKLSKTAKYDILEIAHKYEQEGVIFYTCKPEVYTY